MLRSKRRKQPVLRDKLRGPNARPVKDLVSRAEIAIAPLYAQYHIVAEGQIARVEQLLKMMEADCGASEWEALRSALHDLRSSSATFRAQTLSDFAGSWESMLENNYHEFGKMRSAMHIHLESLRLALRSDLSLAEVDAIKTGLSRLSQVIQSTPEFDARNRSGLD